MSFPNWVGVVLLTMALPAVAAAQAETTVPEFNTIRTPASPAFVLLGVEPTSVARPTTPADFAASLVNASEDFSTLPKDFALEVSPYWLATHARRNWRDDITRNLTESLQRTFTVAAGTAQIGTEEAPVTGVAFSGRAAILSGHLSAETIARLTRLDSLLPLSQEEFLKAHQVGLEAAGALLSLAIQGPAASEATADHTIIMRGLTATEKEREDPAPDGPVGMAQAATSRQLNRAKTQGSEVDHAVADQASKDVARALAEGAIAARPVADAVAKELKGFSSLREGVFLELAAGASWRAPRAVIDSAELGRWGAWLTLSYELPQVSFVGLARYLGAGDTDANDTFDFGGRVVYTRDQYAISLEYVNRHLIDADEDVARPWRLAGLLDYRVSPTVWLTGSFGRDYQDDGPGSLLARLGVSLQLSEDRVSLTR